LSIEGQGAHLSINAIRTADRWYVQRPGVRRWRGPAGDFGRLAGLRLRLWVNGELRQDGTVADMITRPAAALTLLARFQPLDPGDLLLTGTPGGTALQAPPAVIEKLGDLLPTPLKWRVFFSRQERNPAYLKAGDQVTASIATADGTLDLGTQRVVIRDGP